MQTILRVFLHGIFSEAYNILLDVQKKVKRLEKCYMEPMALSKYENIFQIVFDVWFMRMSP